MRAFPVWLTGLDISVLCMHRLVQIYSGGTSLQRALLTLVNITHSVCHTLPGQILPVTFPLSHSAAIIMLPSPSVIDPRSKQQQCHMHTMMSGHDVMPGRVMSATECLDNYRVKLLSFAHTVSLYGSPISHSGPNSTPTPTPTTTTTISGACTDSEIHSNMQPLHQLNPSHVS